MRSLRAAIRRSLPSEGEPYEDGPLPDLISGAMWLATGVVGLAVQALPGVAENSERPWVWVLGAFAIGWGLTSVFLGMRGKVMPIGQRAVVTGAMIPVVGLALWATGGATSYLQPVLLFTVLFVAWFFPPRPTAVLIGMLVLTHATPLPGAGERGVLRLVRTLGEAIHAMQLPGVGTVGVTFAWALAPADAADPNDLVRVADQRLLARKRERRRREAEAASI